MLIQRQPMENRNEIKEKKDDWLEFRIQTEVRYHQKQCKVQLPRTPQPGMFHYQQIKNIIIVRDDLLCGGTKSRLLQLLPQDADKYVYVGNVYGGMSLALASRFGSKVVIIVEVISPARKGELGPLARVAQRLGASFIWTTDVSRSIREMKYEQLATKERIYWVPNGLDLPEVRTALKHIGNQVATEMTTFDVAFIPAASGTLVRGFQQSHLAKKYIAIAIAGGRTQVGLDALQIVHPQKVSEPNPINKMPPYPSTMFYDAKVWPYALAYAQTHPFERVVIWNVL